MSCPLCNKSHAYSIDGALKMLAGTPRRVERLAGGATAKQEASRPSPEKWSAREIVCHLADCELVYGQRYRKIIAEPGAALVAFDQDAWAGNLQYRAQPVKGTLAVFKALRGGNIALFKRIPRAAWNQAGNHPHYGVLTLRQLVVHMADHDRNHLAQLERLLPRRRR
jgi:hypothetical protein